MPMAFGRELFAEVVAELIEKHGFAPPLSMVGVADDGSIFGVRFTHDGSEQKAVLVCRHVKIQFGLPMNLMVVGDANRVARALCRTNGERVVTVL